MVPKVVLEHYAKEFIKIKDRLSWDHAQFPVYPEDLTSEETIADVVEVVRGIFADLDEQVVVTSDGVIHDGSHYYISLHFT